MRETLYLRLGSDPDAEVEFGACGADLRSLKLRRGALGQAAALAMGRRIVVFAPAAEVRLARVKLPASRPAKLMQAVPFALEDQVADDIDTLHFALGPRQPDGSHPVAIVAHDRMKIWLAALHAHGLRPELLVPESLALPVDADKSRWAALANAEQVLVRHGDWAAFACAPEDLSSYLAMADADKTHSLRLQVVGESPSDWSGLEWPVTLLPTPSLLYALANHYKPELAIDLLQGAYAQSQDLQRHWKPWRLAASLLLGWVVLAGLAYSLDSWRMSSELERLDAANVQRFQELFPDQTRVVDLGTQLDQQMRALTGNGAARGPLALLEPLAQTLSATPGLKLSGMQYREGALFLSLTATDLTVLETFRNSFANQRAARLEVQSANAESGGVQIRAKLSAS